MGLLDDIFSGRSSDIFGAGLLTPEQRGGIGNIGLLALAGKLGQLAGPSFSPVPDFGAALGQAAGAYGASQEGAGTAALNAILTAQKGRKLQQELDYGKTIGPALDQFEQTQRGLLGMAGGGGLPAPGSSGGVQTTGVLTAGGAAPPIPQSEAVDKARYYAQLYGVPEEMFLHQINGENGFKASGVSSAGAQGIAQFIPSTARQYGVNVNDVDSSLDGAARYMRDLYKQTGSWEGALRGYLGAKSDATLAPILEKNKPYAAAFAAARGGGAPAAAPTAAAPDAVRVPYNYGAPSGGLLAPTAPNPLSDAEPMLPIVRPAAAPGAGAGAVAPNQVGRFAGIAPGTPVNSGGFPYNPEITDPAVAARVAQSMAAIKQAQQSGLPWAAPRETSGGGGLLATPQDPNRITVPPPAGGSAAPGNPQPGDMVNGLVFKGGDPKDPRSWAVAPRGAITPSGGGLLAPEDPGAGYGGGPPQGPAGDPGPAGPAGPSTPRAPLPTMGPAGIELPPMQGPLAAPAPAAPGPGLLSPPGMPAAAALPQVNPAYDAIARQIAGLRVRARLAGLPDVFEALQSGLTSSPAYQAQLELAKRLGVFPLIGPEAAARAGAEKGEALKYDPLIQEEIRLRTLPYDLLTEQEKQRLQGIREKDVAGAAPQTLAPGQTLVLPGGSPAAERYRQAAANGQLPPNAKVNPDGSVLVTSGLSPEELERQKAAGANVANFGDLVQPNGKNPLLQANPALATPRPSPQGTVIPSIEHDALPRSVEEAKQQAPDFTKTSTQWNAALAPGAIAEQRLGVIANMFKMIQTGAWTTDKANFDAGLKALGLPTAFGNIAEVQTALHSNAVNTLNTLKTATPRFTQSEFQVIARNTENPNLQPEANLEQLGADIATIRQSRQIVQDFYQSGYRNPQAFESAWRRENPLQRTVDAVKQEIGPLRGMTPTRLGTTPSGIKWSVQ